MTRIGLVVLSSLALGAAHSADLCAQGIPKNTRRLGAPAAAAVRVMVANPYASSTSDSSASVAIAAGMRSRLTKVAGTDYTIVSDTVMNTALEQFGYPRNAILSPANALILAKQIPGTKGIVTSTLSRPDGSQYALTSRFFGVLADAGIVQSAQQQPGEKLDAFGARAAEGFKPAFDAFDDAKECEDLRATKPEDATKAAQRSLKSVPDQGLAHLCLAEMAIAQKKPRPEIVSELTAATKGDPLSLTAWTLLAEQHEQAGDTAAVVNDFRQMLLIAPGNQKLREGIFKYLLQAGKPNVAREVADEGLKLDPNNWELYDLKSNACLFQSDFKCAIDALAQAYTVDSTQADSSFYKKISVAAAQQPDTARLLEWSQRGLHKYPTNVELLGYAEQAYLLTGQTDSVVSVAKRLLAADPAQLDPALAAIQSLATAGRISEAAPLIEMVDSKGSPQQKEQLSAILANAALPLLQKQDYVAAADLSRQCVKSADPKGRIIGSCQLIFGLAAFQSAATMDAETEKTKSCDMAKKEDALVDEAEVALNAAKATRPDAVEKPLAAVPQFKARTSSMIKSYCK
jgi:tetratricopeptide (TPR) repeat protein